MPGTTQRQPSPNAARIAQIRRRRKLRELRVVAVLILIVACVAAYFLGMFSAPISLLGDVKDSISIALTPGSGFPQRYALDGFVAAKQMESGLVVVGDGEAVLYSGTGAELRRISYGYSAPSVTAGDARLCLYNRAGKELTVESRSRNLFSQTFTEPITVAQMSKNGTLAVATQTAVEVYSPTFERVWRWQDASRSALLLAFGGDNHRLAAACLQTVDGALGTALCFFDITKDEQIAQADIPVGVPLAMQYLSYSRLLVVYDDFAAVYDTGTGEQKLRYDYGARILQSASIAENGVTALLFGSGNAASVASLVVLNTSLEEQALVQVDARASSVAAGHTMVYVLAGNSVIAYTQTGTLQQENALDTRPLAVLPSKTALLITKDQILPAPSQPEEAFSTDAAGASQPDGTVGTEEAASGQEDSSQSVSADVPAEAAAARSADGGAA